MSNQRSHTDIRISFDHGENLPLHQQIERWFINRIREGHFAESERLPSIRELASSNYISINTVKKAYEYLERAKWIQSKQRLGVFVHYKEEYREEIESNRKIWLLEEKPVSGTAPVVPNTLSVPKKQPIPIFETLLLNRISKRSIIGSAKWGDNAEAYVKQVTTELLYEQSGMIVDPNTQITLFTENERALSFVLRTLFGNRGNLLLVAGVCSGQDKMLLDHCNMIPITINVNENGLVLPHLTVMCKLYRPKALLIDTSLYYMDALRVDRLALENLRQIIQEFDLLVIERNPDRELWYGKGRYPLLSALDKEHTIYLGTISNLVEPLNRVRIIRAPENLMPMLHENQAIKSSLNSDEFITQVAALLAGYKWRRSRKDLYQRYGKIRNMISVLLDERLSAYVSYHMPPSGLACWLYPLSGDFPESIANDLQNLGDTFALRSDFYSSDGYESAPAIYFAFGHLSNDEVDNAIEQLIAVLGPTK